ncbi:MAG: hypothetical protein ACKVQS_11605 [Fimbriimonadaceae bacterium]
MSVNPENSDPVEVSAEGLESRPNNTTVGRQALDDTSMMTGDGDPDDVLSKVPEPTAGFWFVKIVATTLGEVGGNAVSMALGLGYFLGTVAFAVPLIAAVAIQLRARTFKPFLYWATITLTTLAGTTLADFFDRSLGIGYAGGALSLFALVLITLGLWYRSVGTVDVASIRTQKAEGFYWGTIMFSQTLGTALGDWMADGRLGYVGSATLIAVTLIVVAGLHLFTKVSKTALFWAAFVLTRPLGATIANALDKAPSKGGLGMSDYAISAVLAVLMVLSVLLIPQRAARERH